ncbi:stage III sporulation protein AF [Clostridium rectalis]|uniref:stage III sporulation protein AF n=1 Tax=Clostridium rectalis TaxID=2040295 RepID=UPI0013DE2518|nr:stage III sporulation protein AF [Clostridium rectalis]
MLEFLRGWIVNIATIVLFITAVEMILPNNSLKKYSKFVLGLILMTALINPLIKIFNKNFDINIYSENISKKIEEDNFKGEIKEYREKNVDNTVKAFQKNLEEVIEEKLLKEFKGNKYKINTKVEFHEKENKFLIKNINLGIKDNKIKKVKKVQVTLNNKIKKEENVDSELAKNIKEYLGKELNISPKIITIHKI